MASNNDSVPPITEEENSISVVIPVPIPAALYCTKCVDQSSHSQNPRGQGSYAGMKPHLSLIQHLRGSHHPVVTVRFRCRLCHDIFSGLRQANSHVTKSHESQDVALLSCDPPADQTFVCSDCGSVHVSQAGLSSHRRTCKQSLSTSAPASAPYQAVASIPELPVGQLPAPSPLLELTAAHLLGSIAEDLEVRTLPSTPVSTSPVPIDVVEVPSSSWHTPQVPSDPPQLSSHIEQSQHLDRPAPVPAEPVSSSLAPLFEAAATQEQLDAAVAQLVADCAALNKVKAPSAAPSVRRPPPNISALPALAVQRFYNRNRRRSFEQVTGHKSPALEIPIEQLRDSLIASLGTRHLHEAQELLVGAQAPDDITGEPVLAEEVKARFSKATNSAPSPLDRLTYQHLRKFDPEGLVLAALFSACLRTGLTPTAWREYVTTLIFKKPREYTAEEAAIPKNWRPIALLPTISKLFSGVLADRLQQWAALQQAISPAQKGCYSGEGCFEHVHVLTSLRELSAPSKPVHLGFLDLADAFSSVPHGLIFDTLSARGVSAECVQVLRSLYQDCRTHVRNARGESTTVPIQSGVRQGCPASPILFALAIEPLLRTPFPVGSGVEVGGEEAHILAYADDLVVIASSPEALQSKLDCLVARASLLGLSFNPAKCAFLSWGRASPNPARVDGIPIKTIVGGDFYRYLGTPIGLSSWQSDDSVLATFTRELQSVSSSALRPWQKLDALRTFVFARLSYHLRATPFRAQALSRKNGGLDRWAARFVKRILHLPCTASQAYLHTPVHLGGVGLPSARTELALLQVAHFFRMATCPDPVVRSATHHLLQRLVTQRCLVGSPTLGQCASFLNAEMPLLQQGRGSSLSPVLASFAYLRKEIGLRIVAQDTDFALHFQLPDGPSWHITADNRALVITSLHDAVGLAFFNAWKAQPNQGKTAALLAADPAALAPFDRFSGMRFCDWRFLHRARLNLIPTNAVRAAHVPGLSARCRVCGYEQETLPHVLGRCWHHSALLNRRHNALQDAVVAALPRSDDREREVLVNQRPTLLTSDLRVDLTVVDHSSREVHLVDFKSPFEAGPEAFDVARRRNAEKYAGLQEAYRRLGFHCTLDAMCVGALGSWDPANDKVLKQLGISKGRANGLRRSICRAVLHFSRNMWVQHCTGVPQNI